MAAITGIRTSKERQLDEGFGCGRGRDGNAGRNLHPHMLRHGCGNALANAGHDTRALQAWLGHKNIQHTVRYTELSPLAAIGALSHRLHCSGAGC